MTQCLLQNLSKWLDQFLRFFLCIFATSENRIQIIYHTPREIIYMAKYRLAGQLANKEIINEE